MPGPVSTAAAGPQGGVEANGAAIIASIRQRPQVPAPSQTVSKILGMTNSSDCDIVKVADLIHHDAGLTGTLLRQANSAMYASTKATSSTRDACLRLGMKRVRAAVLNDHVVSGLSKARPPGFDAHKYWQSALAASVAAGDLAKKLCPSNMEDAGTAGLLCDIGIGLLAYGYGPYKTILSQVNIAGAVGLERIEQQRLGITHADVGAAVLEDWKLDPLIVDAVRRHHAEPEAGDGSPEKTFALLVGAGVTCSQIALAGPEMELVGRLFSQIGIVSRDPDRLVSEILDQLVAHVQQTAEAMAVELGDVDEMASNFSDAVQSLPDIANNLSFRPMDRHHFDRD